MADRPLILVTGATGNVGSAVIHALLERGAAVCAADRDPARARAAFGGAVEVAAFDFTDPRTFAPALTGVERLFLLRPPAITDMRHTLLPFIDTARAAGVRHIVFLSLLGAERNPIVPHRRVEQHLRRDGMTDWTFLRPSFFMQNLDTTHRDEIRAGELFVPVGRARTSFIDVRDIGAAAAVTLTEEGHAGQAYDLTGPQALDYGTVAAIFTEVLGRPVVYRSPSVWRFVRRQVADGRPPGFALIMAALYTSTRLGMADRVTDTVRQLTGQPPITLRDYVADTRAAWE